MELVVFLMKKQLITGKKTAVDEWHPRLFFKIPISF